MFQPPVVSGGELDRPPWSWKNWDKSFEPLFSGACLEPVSEYDFRNLFEQKFLDRFQETPFSVPSLK